MITRCILTEFQFDRATLERIYLCATHATMVRAPEMAWHTLRGPELARRCAQTRIAAAMYAGTVAPRVTSGRERLGE